ncbi:MAG: glycosyltransferase family protein, partial [Janthinobacterium lividum]
VERIEHLAPQDHPDFYSACGWTLNVTRADMIRAGWSPSVRLFEAGACGCPIVSDRWDGIEDVLTPGRDVVLADDTDTVVKLLDWPAERRDRVAEAAKTRILAAHTSAHRAEQLETIFLMQPKRSARR